MMCALVNDFNISLGISISDKVFTWRRGSGHCHRPCRFVHPRLILANVLLHRNAALYRDAPNLLILFHLPLYWYKFASSIWSAVCFHQPLGLAITFNLVSS
jgi:hypothetical protein